MLSFLQNEEASLTRVKISLLVRVSTLCLSLANLVHSPLALSDEISEIPPQFKNHDFVYRLDHSPPSPQGSPDAKGTLVNYKIMNQQVGNCYANVAALMLDSYLRSKNETWLDWQTSPLSLVLKYAKLTKKESIEIALNSTNGRFNKCSKLKSLKKTELFTMQLSDTLGLLGGDTLSTLEAAKGSIVLNAEEIDVKLEERGIGYDLTRQLMLCYNFAQENKHLPADQLKSTIEADRSSLYPKLTEEKYDQRNLFYRKLLNETFALQSKRAEIRNSKIGFFKRLEIYSELGRKIHNLMDQRIKYLRDEKKIWQEDTCAWIFSSLTRSNFKFYPNLLSTSPIPFQANDPLFSAPTDQLIQLWEGVDPIESIDGFFSYFSSKRTVPYNYQLERSIFTEKRVVLRADLPYSIPLSDFKSKARNRIFFNLYRGRAVALGTTASWVNKIYNPHFDDSSSESPIGHAMAIIGMKCKSGLLNGNSNECKYLIRNSWGTTSQPQTNIPGVEFENYSNLWIPEQYFVDDVKKVIALIFQSDT
jgi:hypothetical protein